MAQKQKAQSSGLIRLAEPSLPNRLLRAFAVRFFFDLCRLSLPPLRDRQIPQPFVGTG